MDPGPPGHHTVTPPLPSPGLMGRAIPEQHSPHLKEQHHIRGSITQGTLPSPSPQTPSPQTPSPRPLVRFCPQAEYRLGIWKQRASPPPHPPSLCFIDGMDYSCFAQTGLAQSLR